MLTRAVFYREKRRRNRRNVAARADVAAQLRRLTGRTIAGDNLSRAMKCQ